MGDRANIVLKADEEQVCLYSHWAGSDLPETLRSALKRGEDRLTDAQYLARIVFCEMLKGDSKGLDGLTGFGITQKPWDGDDRVITVDVEAQTVEIGGKTQSIAEFVTGEDGW